MNEKQKDHQAVNTTPIALRTNFNALALFSPSVTTDAAGVAHATFHLPDNLTRYRIVKEAAPGKEAKPGKRPAPKS